MSDEFSGNRNRRRRPLWAIALGLVLLVGLASTYILRGTYEEKVIDESMLPPVSSTYPSDAEETRVEPAPHLSMVAWQKRVGEPIDGFSDASISEVTSETGGGTLSGEVETIDGEDLPGAKVSILSPAAYAGVSQVTRIDGSFDISGLPEDEAFSLEVIFPGLGVESYDSLRCDGSPHVLRLKSSRTIVVTLTKADGSPITDFEAALWPGEVTQADLDELERLPYKYLHHTGGQFVVTDLLFDTVTVIVRASALGTRRETVDTTAGAQYIDFTAEPGAAE